MGTSWREIPLGIWRQVLPNLEFYEVIALSCTCRLFYYQVLPLCDSIFIPVSSSEEHGWWKDFSRVSGYMEKQRHAVKSSSSTRNPRLEWSKRVLRKTLSKLGTKVHTVHIEDCTGIVDVIQELLRLNHTHSTGMYASSPQLRSASSATDSPMENDSVTINSSGSIKHLCLMNMPQKEWQERNLHDLCVRALQTQRVSTLILTFEQARIGGTRPLFPELVEKISNSVKYLWYDGVHVSDMFLKHCLLHYSIHRKEDQETRAEETEPDDSDSSSESEMAVSSSEGTVWNGNLFMQNLHSVNLDLSHVTEGRFEHTGVNHLVLHSSLVLRQFAMKLPALQYLELQSFRDIPENLFSTLQVNCPDIVDLHLICCFRGPPQASISGMKKLKHFSIRNSCFIQRLSLRQLPELESLSIECDRSISRIELSGLPSLQTVYLTQLNNLRSLHVSDVAQLGRIESLGCPRTELSGSHSCHSANFMVVREEVG
eukprot:gb/GECG01000582.1/.p1 GENE.gb/GECG01000582.1/~~gb/GECG01000582.1/.p1  ORF type:complete len:484 (+),score=35.99 gb/GECG01000582.1/:1-1452(+)